MAPRTGAPRGANQLVETNALYSRLFAGSMFPISEKYRTRFGKGDVMDRINACVQQANMGLMLYLTDLGRETLELDPHTNTVAAKRFGAISELDYTLTPASGPGIDEKLATEIADVVRQHFQRMRGFKQAIYDLAWGVFDGRALVEIDWRYQGGRYPNVPVAVEWIHPRRLAFGPHRELCVIDTFRAGISWWTYNGVPVENLPGKFIRWLPRYFNDYSEREGLLRRSLYWIYFKRFAAYERMVFTELFGKPLRVVEWEKPEAGAPPLNAETYKDAVKEAESLGGTTTASMPQGAHLEMFWPGGNAGTIDLYSGTVKDVDSQMSRLWLGNEATTVMMPSGMGSQSAGVQAAEQNIFLERDSGEIADRIQEDLVRVDVILNWGPDFLDHAPRFHLHAKDEVDRAAEQERLNKAINIGVPVKVSQYAERTGIEIPNDDDAIILLGDAGRARIVDQAAERAAAKASGRDLSLEVGSVSLTPTDMAAVVKVNEARAGQGLPPLMLPGGGRDPDGDLPVSAYRTKMDAMFGGGGGGFGGAPQGGAPPGQAPPPPSSPSDAPAIGAINPPDTLARPPAPLAFARASTESPEEPIVRASTREGAKLAGAWASLLCASVPGDGGRVAARAALVKAARQLPLAPFAAVVERAVVRGALLGAARAHEESFIDRGQTPLPPWRLEGDRSAPAQALRPLPEAVADFTKRAILPAALVVAMRNAARERAQKVAELARQDMLRAAEEEVDAAEGEDGEALRDRLADRFESRGWTEQNDSHAALIFAVAVGLAYHAGRAAQMDQPSVLAERPFRLIRGIDDVETRPPHGAAHGKVLRGDDPFWARAALPWGFSCRCSAASLTADDLRILGLTVTDGATLKGLPDKNWESGGVVFGALFAADRHAVTLARAVRGVLLSSLFPSPEPPQAPPPGPKETPRPPEGSPALADGGAGLPTGAWPDPRPEPGNETALMEDRRAGAVVGTVLTFSGVAVRIDRPVGFVQAGVGADGEPWTRTYSVPYGEILGTEGGDGEPLDVFCGPAADAPIVFWAEQKKADGTFDEFKLGLGWESQGAFVAAYLAHIPAHRLGNVWSQPIAQVKALLGLDPQRRAEQLRVLLTIEPAPGSGMRAVVASRRAIEASEDAADASRIAHGGPSAALYGHARDLHQDARRQHEAAALEHEAAAASFPVGSPDHAWHTVEAKRHDTAATEHGKAVAAESGHAAALRGQARLAGEGSAPVRLEVDQPRDKDGRWMAGAAFAGGASHATKIEGPAFGTGGPDPHSMAKWAAIKAAETGKVVYATPSDTPHGGGFHLATKIGVRDSKKGYSAVHPDGRVVHYNGGAPRGNDPVRPPHALNRDHDVDVDPPAPSLAGALADLDEALTQLDALYTASSPEEDDPGLFAYNPDQPRGPDGRWGGDGETRVASAGSKDGLGRSKAAGLARAGSTAAKAATVAAKSGGSHADAAKAHADAAAQHREAAGRSARADYKAAHEMAAAAHENVAKAHRTEHEKASAAFAPAALTNEIKGASKAAKAEGARLLGTLGHEAQTMLAQAPLRSLTLGSTRSKVAAGMCYGYQDGRSAIVVDVKKNERPTQPGIGLARWNPQQLRHPDGTPDNTGKPFVTLAQASSPAEMREITLAHEVGHAIHNIDRVKADPIMHAAYDRMKSSGFGAITRYAETNPHEYFAENFALYNHSPEKLHTADPNAHQMVRDVIRAVRG